MNDRDQLLLERQMFYGALAQPNAGLFGNLFSKPKHLSKPILSRGDKGPAVSEAQTLLKIPADGDFGPQTESAVQAFNASKGISAGGTITQETWAALLGETYKGTQEEKQVRTQQTLTDITSTVTSLFAPKQTTTLPDVTTQTGVVTTSDSSNWPFYVAAGVGGLLLIGGGYWFYTTVTRD